MIAEWSVEAELQPAWFPGTLRGETGASGQAQVECAAAGEAVAAGEAWRARSRNGAVTRESAALVGGEVIPQICTPCTKLVSSQTKIVSFRPASAKLRCQGWPKVRLPQGRAGVL